MGLDITFYKTRKYKDPKEYLDVLCDNYDLNCKDEFGYYRKRWDVYGALRDSKDWTELEFFELGKSSIHMLWRLINTTNYKDQDPDDFPYKHKWYDIKVVLKIILYKLLGFKTFVSLSY